MLKLYPAPIRVKYHIEFGCYIVLQATVVIATGKMDTKHPLRTLRPSAAASAKSGRVGSWGHRAHWQRPVLLA